MNSNTRHRARRPILEAANVDLWKCRGLEAAQEDTWSRPSGTVLEEGGKDVIKQRWGNIPSGGLAVEKYMTIWGKVVRVAEEQCGS